jgi:hypothetical protein
MKRKLAARLGALAALLAFALPGGGCSRAPVASATPPSSSVALPPAPSASTGLTASDLDKVIRVAWTKESVAPAPTVDDARFLRRAHLDITGVIPSIDAVTAFLADEVHRENEPPRALSPTRAAFAGPCQRPNRTRVLSARARGSPG